MLSRSDGNLLERPPSGLNPAAQMVAQPLNVQFVQAVPVLHPFYQQNVPLVMSQVPRMPVTVLPQPVTVSHQPATTESKFLPSSF